MDDKTDTPIVAVKIENPWRRTTTGGEARTGLSAETYRGPES